MASKGSIAVDGVSLTIVDSEPDRFSVALIPYTLAVTTLGPLRVGGKVNLETDILAKYVQRLIEADATGNEHVHRLLAATRRSPSSCGALRRRASGCGPGWGRISSSI